MKNLKNVKIDFNLNSGFCQVDSPRKFFPDEGIRVVSPFEDPLKGCQLLAVEGRPRSPLLRLVLRVLVLSIDCLVRC